MDQDIVNHFVIMGPQGPDTMPQFQGISGTGTSTRYSPHTWASVGAAGAEGGGRKMVCPRQTGVVNPTAGVCRTRQGWQGGEEGGGGMRRYREIVGAGRQEDQ